jgi:phasin family protein
MANTGFDPSKYPFPDIGKMMEQFKVPGIDVSKIIEGQRKDIEALTQANQAAFAAVQELAKRQVEILQETATQWQAMMGQGASGDGANIGKQTELAQKAFGKAFNNMREMAEVTARTQTQAWELIQKRVQENLAELRNLMQPPK